MHIGTGTAKAAPPAPMPVPHTLYFAAPPVDGPHVIHVLSYPSAASPPYLTIEPLSMTHQSFAVRSPESSDAFLFKFILENDDSDSLPTDIVAGRFSLSVANIVDVFSSSKKLHSLRVSDKIIFTNPFQPNRVYRWSVVEKTDDRALLLERTGPLPSLLPTIGSMFTNNLAFKEVVATFELVKIPYRFKNEQDDVVRIVSKLSSVFENPEDIQFDSNAKWDSLEECAFMAGVANVAANQIGFLTTGYHVAKSFARSSKPASALLPQFKLQNL
ncbi:hypothetical protein HDU83_006036 [Entophlyctis luteolus]|nr:hypothetical protein HDU83_006036 [Entophlyctis luteolus]